MVIEFHYARLHLQLLNDINTFQVLEPLCSNGLPTQKEMVLTRRYLKESSRGLQRSQPTGPALWCRVSLSVSLNLLTDVYMQRSSHNHDS